MTDMPANDKLERIKRNFIARLDERLVAMNQSLDHLEQSPDDTAVLEELHRQLHNLHGAFGVYGYQSLARQVGQLEAGLKECLARSVPLSDGEVATLREELGKIAILGGAQDFAGTPPVPGPDHATGDLRRPLIRLLHGEAGEAQVLMEELSASGFCVEMFQNPDNLLAELHATGAERGGAVILDLDSLWRTEAYGRLIRACVKATDHRVAVLVLSKRSDLEARLEVFRMGATRYLQSPVKPGQLVSILDVVTGRQPAEPFRVLLVDDDEEMLANQGALLRQAGMNVHGLSDPMRTLDALDAFGPDVIVLDVYMPGASGPELAAVIRERDDSLQTPILFLSSETDMSRQLQALSLGGDDFLVKTVDAGHFVSSVRTRARRARQARAIERRLATTVYEQQRVHRVLDDHAIVSVTDAQGNIKYVNDLFCRISGYTDEELIGQNHRILKSGEHGDELYRDLWKTIASGETWHGEIANRRKDGELYWVASTITPFLDDEGKPYQYISIRTDITEHRRREDALRESERKFRTLVANIPGMVYRMDFAGQMEYISNSTLLCGYSREELATGAVKWPDIVHSADRGSVSIAPAKVSGPLADPAVQQYRILHRDGECRWVSDYRKAMFAPDGALLWVDGVVFDITRRKLAEIEAERYRERLQRGQLYANVGTWEWDIATRALYWSEGIPVLFGLPERMTETSYERFIRFVHPDDRAAVEEAIKQCLENDTPLEVEHRIVRPDGTVRWLMEKGDVSRDEQGSPVQMFGVVLDTTEAVASRQALEQARDEAERANQAKSRFLSSMSHELRTPMNAILGFSQLMEYDDSLSGLHKDSVHEIHKAGEHLLELIDEVLDLAKVESGRMHLSLEPVEVLPVVEECFSLVRTQAEKRELSISQSVPAGSYVMADRIRLKQAMLNLLSNAIKYNRAGGSVSLTLQECDGDATRVVVCDTGKGIPGDQLRHIFDPFNRLDAERSEVPGTGIGLSLTRRIVGLMGGQVGVDSTPGVGSDFWIELPKAQSDTLEARPGAEPMPGADLLEEGSGIARQLILYIEDNPANLKLVEQVMRRQPSRALLSAHTPELGIDLMMQHKPDLILLDINLPGMDGYEVLEWIRGKEDFRETPVVAVTANAMPHDVQRGMTAGFDDYLGKPLDLKHFLEVLERHLL